MRLEIKAQIVSMGDPALVGTVHDKGISLLKADHTFMTIAGLSRQEYSELRGKTDVKIIVTTDP